MPDDSRIGAVLAGKYELTRLHGRGAFGAVYEATNVEIGKRVAVKLIEPQYVRNEEVVARFRIEARAASRVESEHIVQVFDVGHDAEHGLFMVMELLQGEDLAARLDREFKLSPAVAVHICVQAARALAKAHAAGVVHRDLKPANVFLITREDGSLLVKLVDFGISKILSQDARAGDRAGDRVLTRMGTVVGTPTYMSPEQTRGLPIDGRTDVWSLGAVLYEMLAGAPCYPHAWSYEETIIAIATGPEPRILDVAPWVPKEVGAVVDAALTRDLERRIPDGTTFATMLAEAMPQAARPRREESLYMEPSDFSDEPPREPTREQIEQTIAIASDHPLPQRANTTVAVVRPPALDPERARKPVWPWVVVLLLALSAAAVFGAYRAGWIRAPDAEPANAAPPPDPSPSPSPSPSAAVAVAPKPMAPRPVVQKPKPSLTATSASSVSKTSAKSSATATPKKP